MVCGLEMTGLQSWCRFNRLAAPPTSLTLIPSAVPMSVRRSLIAGLLVAGCASMPTAPATRIEPPPTPYTTPRPSNTPADGATPPSPMLISTTPAPGGPVGRPEVAYYLNNSAGYAITLEELRHRWNALAPTNMLIEGWDRGFDSATGAPIFSYSFPIEESAGALSLQGTSFADDRLKSVSVTWAPRSPTGEDIDKVNSAISTLIGTVDTDSPDSVIQALHMPPPDNVPVGIDSVLDGTDSNFALITYKDTPLPLVRLHLIAFT